MSRHTFIDSENAEVGKSPSAEDVVGVVYAFPEIDESVAIDFRTLDRAVQTAGMRFGLHTRLNNQINSAMHKVKDASADEKAFAGHEALESLLEDWADGRWGAERGDGLGRISDFVTALARYRAGAGADGSDEWIKARRAEIKSMTDDGRKEFVSTRMKSEHGPGIKLILEELAEERRQRRLGKLAEQAANVEVTAETVADL